MTSLLLSSNHLKSLDECKKTINGITYDIHQQCQQANFLLHSNAEFIQSVIDGNSHDPSMHIESAHFSISTEKAEVTHTQPTKIETIRILQNSGNWEEHVANCKQRYNSSQNWLRWMNFVTLYEKWEGDYRHALCEQIDVKNDKLNGLANGPIKLLHPIFGDLRRFRNDWIHSSGKCNSSDPDKLEVIQLNFKKGEQMTLHDSDDNGLRCALIRTLAEFPKGFSVRAKT